MEPFRGFLSLSQWLSFGMAAALICGAKVPRRVLWGVIALEAAMFLWLVGTMEPLPGDAMLFWKCGRMIWSRMNPYEGTHVLNPPPSLVWYATLSLLPQMVYLVFFRILGAACFAGAAFAARAALKSPPDPEPGRLTRETVAILALAVALSASTRVGLFTMSSTFVTTACLIGAVACRGRGKPGGAGALLALGSLKITTMLPFLLLFLRKRDLRTWAVLIGFGLVLTMLVISPARLPEALASNLKNIRDLSGPGQLNDYSFDSTLNADFISLDYGLYHLGVRNRGTVRALQMAAIAGLGAWVAWQMLRRPAFPHAPAAATAACFSALFLYHRLYDMPILALPLVYCAGRGLSEPGRLRWAYRACALSTVWVLHLRIHHLDRLAGIARRPGAVARFVEAIVLPHGTWLVLAVLIVLAVVERRSAAALPEPGAPAGTAA